MVNWLVPEVQLTGNNVVLTIRVDGFTYGNWAEISGFIIQDDVIVDGVIQQRGAFIPFSAIQEAPAPATGASLLTVNVAATGLNREKDVKVITRVAEVQIWPTVLKAAPPAQAVPGGTAVQAVPGGTAVWQAREGNPDSDPRVQWSGGPPGAMPATPAATVQVSGVGPSISMKNLPPGRQYRITVEAVGP
jgi:hypothetical protein